MSMIIPPLLTLATLGDTTQIQKMAKVKASKMGFTADGFANKLRLWKYSLVVLAGHNH
jgi:hypothetical protein